MDEFVNQELTPTPSVSYDGLLAKWLHVLYPVQLISVVLAVLSGLQILPVVISLAAQVIAVCVIVVLFSIAPANPHYKTAAILRCVSVGGSLLIMIVPVTIFTFAISVCSIISAYQEYKGHSLILEVKDQKLSQKWMTLFGWQLAVGILAGLLSAAGTVIGVLVGISVQTLISVILIFTTVMSACVQVFYLVYLKRMLAYFPK